MLNIKYNLLLILVSFSYQAFKCLDTIKVCNPYSNPSIPHCTLGASNQCLSCEENYSPSNDRTKCINVPHCSYFDSQEKCSQCNFYYNFDSNGNCVKDYCITYHNKTCIQCYQGFYLKNQKCERISIPYCLSLSGETCSNCAPGTELVGNECKIKSVIEGCNIYNSDRTACLDCEDNYNLENGKCTFTNQCNGYPVLERCRACEDGYYVYSITYECIGYDGTKESSNANGNSDNKAGRINLNLALFYSLLGLI